ncbi:MAG: hypothetical protein IPJ65_43400 [Archangiaceae bacterium]|nr:hypothetical protein [Archangiaceae bacterium]
MKMTQLMAVGVATFALSTLAGEPHVAARAASPVTPARPTRDQAKEQQGANALAAACVAKGCDVRAELDSLCVAFDAADQLFTQHFKGRKFAELSPAESELAWSPLKPFVTEHRNTMSGKSPEGEPLLCCPSVIGSFVSLANVPDSQKAALLKQTATDAGVKGWSCPAMDRFFAH